MDETLATFLRKHASMNFRRSDRLPKPRPATRKAAPSSVLSEHDDQACRGLSDKDAAPFAPDMRTSPEWLLSLRKHKAGFRVRMLHQKTTPRTPFASLFPFGVIENAPKMSAEEHKALRQRNRERYGTSSSANVNHENSLSQTHEAPAKKASNEVPRSTADNC